MLILLFPGFVYGVGNLILRLWRQERSFGESVAVSMVLWSVVGWLSFGHFREVVLVLSAAGTLWTIYTIATERPGINLAVVLFFVAIFLRYALTFPFLYPYQKDFIMHVYSTATILHYNGYGPEYYPFGVPGFGAFNVGFHFVSSGLSYVLYFHPINAVLVATYIFWGLFFWAIYRWVGNPVIALISVFVFPYPLSYLRWGGFPTLASISLGLMAFRMHPRNALPYWIGAFSFHFIPVIVPFFVYLASHLRRWRAFLPYVALLILVPQYYLIFKWASNMSSYETAIVDSFVISRFPNSSLVVLFLIFFALMGYRIKRDLEVPMWGIVLSVFAGVISFLFAYFHVPINAPKSLYMSRMVLLLLPPASFGILYVWRKIGLPLLVLPLSVSLYMAYLHYTVRLDPDDWKALWEVSHKIPRRGEWFLTSYWNEGSYLPAFGSPSWMSHYIVSQVDEFREAARRNGFRYVVCDREDEIGPIPYYREVCERGERHEDVEGVVVRGKNLTVYELKRVIHPDMP